MILQTEIMETIKESDLFDAAWYRERYPDVEFLGMDPVEHYLKIGARLGRDPGPNFSTLGYIQAYPDVEQAGFNPLYHFLKWGKTEGRLAPSSRLVFEERQIALTTLRASERCEIEGAQPPPARRPEEETGSCVRSSEGLEQEYARVQKKCEELTQENELLLLQLHQVQEELEEYFLKYQELAAKEAKSA